MKEKQSNEEKQREYNLHLEFVSVGEALARNFPEISEFTKKELEQLVHLIHISDSLNDKETFISDPLVIKTINFVIKNKDKLVHTVSVELKLAEMTDLLKRTQANFENYRKQQEKRIEEIQQFASRDIIVQLLPLLDNFELALKNNNCSKEDLAKGIELIYAQLFETLEQNGVKTIITADQNFDPYLHEALLKIPSEQPENRILEELQKGFTLHDKVIRHAKVKLSAGQKQQ